MNQKQSIKISKKIFRNLVQAFFWMMMKVNQKKKIKGKWNKKLYQWQKMIKQCLNRIKFCLKRMKPWWKSLNKKINTLKSMIVLKIFCRLWNHIRDKHFNGWNTEKESCHFNNYLSSNILNRWEILNIKEN